MNNSYFLLKELHKEKIPHRLIIQTNDNWDKPLPQNIIQSYSENLVLDISEKVLNDCYIDENENIIIRVYFNGSNSPHTKKINPFEIVGITKTNGEPYIINNFPNSTKNYKMKKSDYIEILEALGIERNQAKKSLNLFLGDEND